jgi:hypothetical protein
MSSPLTRWAGERDATPGLSRRAGSIWQSDIVLLCNYRIKNKINSPGVAKWRSEARDFWWYEYVRCKVVLKKYRYNRREGEYTGYLCHKFDPLWVTIEL